MSKPLRPELTQPSLQAALPDQSPIRECTHPRVPLPAFDEKAAAGMSSREVKERWPRTVETCPDCNLTMTMYASFTHYIAGDW